MFSIFFAHPLTLKPGSAYISFYQPRHDGIALGLSIFGLLEPPVREGREEGVRDSHWFVRALD